MEIERKFLTEKIPFDLSVYRKLEIRQGYISTNPTIRLRKSNDEYFLCVKSSGNMVREEFELELSEQQFKTLWQKIETNAVEKTRYLVPISEELTAEIDIYKNALSGLITTEVEFVTEEDANNFVPPEWFGEDVTNDRRYSNGSLSIYGIPS